ncbi:UBP-type zinc finger domain-containing protein [Spongisporangium articulatum]|uniref:UBP-type zinc finger domain-containing protein n=1 Tax=Spongisporangium articulatum TaxID=3362603 RepID=A0ABW8ALJ2_9ACTN
MTEISGIDPAAVPSGTGCADCDALGGWWFHLRRCAQCGHIGCCDSSPAQHASAHARETGHRIVRSFEPGEDWFWDYVTEDYYDGPALADPQARPAGQSVPGPKERVPADWKQHLHM